MSRRAAKEQLNIEEYRETMKQVYDAGIRTVCFISPVFPGITDIEAIIERTKDQCDLVWLENLNLRGGFRKTIVDYFYHEEVRGTANSGKRNKKTD